MVIIQGNYVDNFMELYPSENDICVFLMLRVFFSGKITKNNLEIKDLNVFRFSSLKARKITKLFFMKLSQWF
jgi:hypothetical protein